MILKKMKVSAMMLLWCVAINVSAQGYVRPHNEITPKPTTDVAVSTGSFEPDWDSLAGWKCPEWFRDAKFGIWAHWGPQCQAEDGDWYARFMYYDDSSQYWWHYNHYGNPADYGLKELCRDWVAANWNPEELIALYKSVGARYFFTLGQHHDNFDLWNSPYQEWNSVNMGPGRDVVKGWSDACKKYGLPLGVSMHGSHAWTWLEGSQDYDGNLKADEGAGMWWEGYDPQELYAQRHAHSTGWESSGTIHSQWAWGNGASLPDAAYKQKFQNRVLQCINDYQPDMLYFDDTVLPFYGCDESVGLNILSHYYNTSAARDGEVNVVAMGKILEDRHKLAMLWDVERGIPDRVQDDYWQTCTCIGSWHYDINVYNNGGYKSAQQVVDMLVDIVSKNGNLLLSVPIRANGTIDDKEMAVLEGIKAWMDVNSSSIYGTRPWKTFGEGPLYESSNPLSAQGFNENINYSSTDVRYVERNDSLFATIMRWPSSASFTFTTLGICSKYYSGKVKSVKLLGYGDIDFHNDIDGLVVAVPTEHPAEIAPVYVITFDPESSDEVTLAMVIELYEQKVTEMRLKASSNTGKLSRTAVNEFAQLVQEAKSKLSADETTQLRTIRSLHQAYTDLKENGINQGGPPANSGFEDLTFSVLKEADHFSRTDETQDSGRFGAPKYWTVENFGFGSEAGLDSATGQDCLHLEVWWNQSWFSDNGYDITNVRIYQKATLPAGTYYFGASYPSAEANEDLYIFASEQLVNTSDIPEMSIAYEKVNKAPDDGTFRGITFTLEKETEVYLGFQADFSKVQTNNLRASGVKLLSYGELDFNALDDLISIVYEVLADVKVNDNTGYYSPSAVKKLTEAMEAAYNIDYTSSAEELQAVYDNLSATYDDFKANGRNQGGTPVGSDYEDWTLSILTEADHFSRTNETLDSGRFGAPKYWTVENFGFGSEAGLDNITGQDCLHLEVWWNQNAYYDNGYDITNVRLYQKTTLPAGRYYFGASYPSAEANEDLYIFASDRLLNTSDIPIQSIAFEQVKKAPADGTFRGLFFTLEEETEVYLGFQTDFSKVQTNNLRVSGVKLLYYGQMNAAKVVALLQDIETELATLTINDNTGFYRQEAVDALQPYIDAARTIDNNSTYDEIIQAYNNLATAYTDLIKNGKNPAGEPDDIGATDLTASMLVESTHFSRIDGQSTTTRYGTPLNWTVENYYIHTDNEGPRTGLDRYPGYDCLTIGIWNDRDNSETDLTNARIYRSIHLPAGRYYFGATYEANYQLYEAYIFAAAKPLATSDIPTQSIAYDPITDAGKDNRTYRGIYFTLDEEQDLILGFQADMQQGSATQEFRASNVMLLGYDMADAISTPEQNQTARIDFSRPFEVYNLAGQRLNTVPAQGIVVIRQGGKTQKLIMKH